MAASPTRSSSRDRAKIHLQNWKPLMWREIEMRGRRKASRIEKERESKKSGESARNKAEGLLGGKKGKEGK